MCQQMVLLSGPETVIVGNRSKEKIRSVCIPIAKVCNTLLDLRRFVLRKKFYLKKIGKILKEVKLCALTRVR
jgi:hypothetical protein